MPKEIILYSAQMCGDCQKLKDFMESKGIRFEIRDVRAHPEYAKEVEENTGKMGVPYLVIDGEWVCGYDLESPFSEDFASSLFER